MSSMLSSQRTGWVSWPSRAAGTSQLGSAQAARPASTSRRRGGRQDRRRSIGSHRVAAWAMAGLCQGPATGKMVAGANATHRPQGRPVAAQHPLLRAVPGGHRQGPVPAGLLHDQRQRRLAGAANGHHAARAGAGRLGHQPAPRHRGLDRLLGREAARQGDRRKLAQRMTRHRLRRLTHLLAVVGQRQRDGHQRGLGDVAGLRRADSRSAGPAPGRVPPARRPRQQPPQLGRAVQQRRRHDPEVAALSREQEGGRRSQRQASVDEPAPAPRCKRRRARPGTAPRAPPRPRCPAAPRGMRWRRSATTRASRRVTIPVSSSPGSTALTRMPLGASSAARLRVKATMPPFDAA